MEFLLLGIVYIILAAQNGALNIQKHVSQLASSRAIVIGCPWMFPDIIAHSLISQFYHQFFYSHRKSQGRPQEEGASGRAFAAENWGRASLHEFLAELTGGFRTIFV